MRHNDANKMTPHPTPCHMCHSQNFDKIDSFLKPVLKSLFSATWGVEEVVIIEGTGILHWGK